MTLRKSRIHLIGPLIFATHLGLAPAEADDHGPFASGQEPPRCHVWECTRRQLREDSELEGRLVEYYLPANHKTTPRLRFENDEHGNTIATLLNSTGIAILGPAVVSDNVGFFAVYAADLNNDGIVDFVAEVWCMGCGLAAVRCHVVFFLSGPNGYRVTTIATATSDSVADRLFCIGADKHVDFLQTSTIWGVGRDKKEHMFWVHQLLAIQGNTLIVSGRDKRFPIWVWYTFKPNHDETTLLNSRQKTILLQDALKKESIFWKAK